MRRFYLVALSAVILTWASSGAEANFKKNQIAKVGKVTCGFSGSWFPVKKVGKSFTRIAKPSGAQKTACKSLLVASKVSLTKLPDLSGIAASGRASNQTVSGTPPTLAEIISGNSAEIFWRPGVVSSIASGTPSSEQCREFFSGTNDGESSGFLGCYLSYNSGNTLAEVVRAGTTMCYLKNMPTPETLAAGGFRVVRGELPSGGVRALFSTPAGSTTRIVKIGLSAGGRDGGESTGIIKIFGANQIAAAGDLYRYEMIFCEGDSSEPQEVEQTRITSVGEFVSNSFNVRGGGEGSRFSGTVRAFLRSEDGSFVFDATRDRTAQFVSSQSERGQTVTRKASVVLSSGNEIENKEYAVTPEETRKAFSVSAYSGVGITGLRFIEGAIKQTFARGDFSGATEYRDTVYAAAPSSRLVSSLDEVDLVRDEFFSGTPAPQLPSVSLSCDSQADIEVEVAMESDSIQQVTQLCELERLPEGVDFCRTAQLEQAQDRFNSVCSIESR